jgi:hypothetical protein
MYILFIFLSILVHRVFWEKAPVVLSSDSTKTSWLRRVLVAKYQITCFHIKTLNFNYKDWDIMYNIDFAIYSSKCLLRFIYFCLLLNYKNILAFYQVKKTNKMVCLEVGIIPQTNFHIKPVSPTPSSSFLYFNF